MKYISDISRKIKRSKKTMKRNFKSKPHLLCPSDELRPAISYIYFDKEYLYCTDALALLKQKIELHKFEPHEIAFLDGKLLHKNVFKELLRYNFVEITEEGFLAKVSNENKVLFKFSEFNDLSLLQRMKDVLNEHEKKPLTEIGLNPELLNNIAQAFVCDIKNVKLEFNQKYKGILVTSTDSDYSADQVAILMPISITYP